MIFVDLCRNHTVENFVKSWYTLLTREYEDVLYTLGNVSVSNPPISIFTSHVECEW